MKSPSLAEELPSLLLEMHAGKTSLGCFVFSPLKRTIGRSRRASIFLSLGLLQRSRWIDATIPFFLLPHLRFLLPKSYVCLSSWALHRGGVTAGAHLVQLPSITTFRKRPIGSASRVPLRRGCLGVNLVGKRQWWEDKILKCVCKYSVYAYIIFFCSLLVLNELM